MLFGPGPLFLVGFMGCGKSSVGERLAGLLGRPFEDSDAEIERREGRTIAEIIADAGEPYFRVIESELLLGYGGGNAVVATGGGAMLRAENRRALWRNGCVVWLDASLESCRERIGAGESRPLWPSGDRLAQRAIFERRRAVYALADLRIVSDDSAENVASGLARLLRREIP